MPRRAPWEPAPLQITCHLAGPIALSTGGLALDALLMAAVSIRDRLPPPVTGAPRGPDPPIPVPLSACGRVYLASVAYAAFDAHETRYRNRRFPAREALRLTAMRRVDVAAGPQKSYRIPYAAGHVAADRLEWWCLGKATEVRALLGLVHHVGRHRGVGVGRVVGWEVVPCEPWDGFPVVRDGRPLRPLPLDWPGLTDYAPAYGALRPPYWMRDAEEPCAVPA